MVVKVPKVKSNVISVQIFMPKRKEQVTWSRPTLDIRGGPHQIIRRTRSGPRSLSLTPMIQAKPAFESPPRAKLNEKEFKGQINICHCIF